jgi:hypothetical protein
LNISVAAVEFTFLDLLLYQDKLSIWTVSLKDF